MRLAAKMPIVIMSWKPMLSMPRSLAGAISDRYTGTDCTFQIMLTPFRMVKLKIIIIMQSNHYKLVIRIFLCHKIMFFKFRKLIILS